MGADPTGRERTRVAIEAGALALLAALPLLPYLLYLRTHHVERFSFTGDFAGLELATRYVPSGRTLLGPYSRFGFNHPGPLYFYALAPIYALWGSTSTGILAGAGAINAAAVMVTVGATRLATTRTHAVAVALVVLAWLGAFGNVCANPWNPLVVVLPLIAFLVLVALVTTGSWRALPFAVVAGAFAAETHLSTIPAVLGVALVAGAVVRLRVRRGLVFGRTGRSCALVSLALLLLTVAPPVVEELTNPHGNITKVVHFFGARTEPMRPMSAALTDWTHATSWLPDRLLLGTVAQEYEPEVMRSRPPWGHVTTTGLRATVALLLLTAGAAAIAWRRRDAVSLAFLGVGGLTGILSVIALRAIVGPNYTYLLFWTTAGTTLLWMGVLGAVGKVLADLLERAPPRAIAQVASAVVLAAAFALALRASSLQHAFLTHEALRPVFDASNRRAYDVLRARVAQTGETPVLHAMGAWQCALSFLLEASKDGVDARVVDRERWLFGRQPAGIEGLAHPLHVFIQTPEANVSTRACMQKLATVGTIELYTSPVDVEVCAPSP